MTYEHNHIPGIYIYKVYIYHIARQEWQPNDRVLRSSANWEVFGRRVLPRSKHKYIIHKLIALPALIALIALRALITSTSLIAIITLTALIGYALIGYALIAYALMWQVLHGRGVNVPR